MKQLQLAHLKDDAVNLNFDQAKQLQIIVEAPIGAQGGVSVGEMRQLIKIGDKLEAIIKGGLPYKPLLLEDAEWELVNARVQAFPWPKVSKTYLDFADLIANAPSKSDVARTEAEPAKEEAKAEAVGA